MLGTKISFSRGWEGEYYYLIKAGDVDALNTKAYAVRGFLAFEQSARSATLVADNTLSAISYEDRHDLAVDVINSIMGRYLSGFGSKISSLELVIGRGFISGKYDTISGREFGFEVGSHDVDDGCELGLYYDVFEGLEFNGIDVLIDEALVDANAEQAKALMELKNILHC